MSVYSLETLYPLVTEAIRRAEVYSDIGAPGARTAYLDVSLLEERIAHFLPPSDPEGVIARRGAVRAAVSAAEVTRARELVYCYSMESGATDALRADLEALVPRVTAAGVDVRAARRHAMRIRALSHHELASPKAA